jgi:hypothetical protein
MMKPDAAIERTRDARRGISNRFGDDPAKIVEYYMEMQKRFAARLRLAPDVGKEDGGMAEHRLPADAQNDARR